MSPADQAGLHQAVTRSGRCQKGHVRQTGSHVVLTHPISSRRVVVPAHRGAILNPKTLDAILAAAGMSADALTAPAISGTMVP
jgi:predicted RNA binding protein YcfA (HicA-like mRNA interferase family)